MKLLIIEDEKRAREGLFKLISNQFNELNLLPPATNGREGLKQIEKEAPDIILTDIRMPDLDGLEMLSLIPRNKTAPYIAVISGYSDFEYARRSLHLGVKDYILKPFTTENLFEIVEKAILTVQSSNVLTSIMEEENEPPGNSTGCQFLFRYNPILDEKEIYTFLRKNIIRLLHPDDYLDEYIDTKKNIVSFYLQTEKEIDFSEINLGEIIRHIDQKYPGQIIGTWSSLSEDAARMNQLIESLVCHRFSSHTSIIKAELILSTVEPLTNYPWQQEKNLMRDLRQGDTTQSQDSIEEWFYELTKKNHNPSMLMDQTEKLIITIMNTLKEVNINGFREATRKNFVGKLKDCLTQQETLNLLYDLLSFFSFTISVPNTESQLIQRVLQYINSHLQEPITLEETAEYVQISPEHLSRLFKDETDSGFNHYVNSSKIEKARELLLKDSRTISSISEELGYSSSRYFARVFKKMTAMTPREFRELRQN